MLLLELTAGDSWDPRAASGSTELSYLSLSPIPTSLSVQQKLLSTIDTESSGP